MSLASAVGQLFIFHTINSFGPVVFASIMTARQFFSILLSIYSFKHAVSPKGCVGLALVFAAMVFKVALAYQKKRRREAQKQQLRAAKTEALRGIVITPKDQ
jgi:hypothetical protein